MTEFLEEGQGGSRNRWLDTVMEDRRKLKTHFFKLAFFSWSSWAYACDSSWKRLTFGVMVIIIILESHWFKLQAWPTKIETNGEIWPVGCRGGLLQRKDNESSMVSQVSQRYVGCTIAWMEPQPCKPWPCNHRVELTKGPTKEKKIIMLLIMLGASAIHLWGQKLSLCCWYVVDLQEFCTWEDSFLSNVCYLIKSQQSFWSIVLKF